MIVFAIYQHTLNTQILDNSSGQCLVRGAGAGAGRGGGGAEAKAAQAEGRAPEALGRGENCLLHLSVLCTSCGL